MGRLAVFKYFLFLMLVAQFVATGFTIFGLLGQYADPARNTAMAMLVYILPLLVVINLILMIYWLFRKRWILGGLAAVTVLCCIPHLLGIWQPSLFSSADNTKHGIRIATYNVAKFGREVSGFIAEDILTEMKNQNVDILCLQEYLDDSGERRNSERYGEYFQHMKRGKADMVIFSRYPIRDSQTIEFGNTHNSGMWADIDINGRRVRVVNVHMQTTGISRTLRDIGKMEQQGADVEENAIIRAVYGNYMHGMAVRARQADGVAEEISRSPHPVILCGDFNDIPNSYVYHKLLGNLVDGFKECGTGWMYTFRGKKRFRIDYIFHDESITGINYYKQDLTYSDHLPVFMTIVL